MEMVEVTLELIDAGESGSGGWNAKQLKIIGVSWPPRKGWKYRAVGKLITENEARRFVELCGKTKQPRKLRMPDPADPIAQMDAHLDFIARN